MRKSLVQVDIDRDGHDAKESGAIVRIRGHYASADSMRRSFLSAFAVSPSRDSSRPEAAG